MRIGIIGSGKMGGTLARHLGPLGHQVLIANSRGSNSLTELAADLGAVPSSIAGAVSGAQLIILAIPTKAVPQLPHDLFASTPGAVPVIDTGNYHPELRDGRIAAIDEGLCDSQWVAQQLARPVIKAFNHIFDTSLDRKGLPPGSRGRIALSVMGDSPEAKATTLALIDSLGFDPIDGGGLADSWRQQPGTPAYCRDLEGPALRRALASAERGRVGEYRAAEEARIKRLISGLAADA